MASLSSILILGADAAAAAHPATPVQLVHACRRWGFSAIIPASWGDELIADEVIRRCATRSNRPVVQCSCPRVAERLAEHAAHLDDAIFWLIPPPVAVARYLRAMSAGADIHVTYAGNCPGASDPSIDERVSPDDLVRALMARGIDPATQPTVFEDIIPADRRRHASSPGGIPEKHRLWEDASFRVSHTNSADLAISVAQMLLSDERLLIDPAGSLGCVCRATSDPAPDAELQRAPSPIILRGQVDLARTAPVVVTTPALQPSPPQSVAPSRPADSARPIIADPRPSVSRASYRRQSTWRRQSPRPGVVVARTSSAVLTVNEDVPLMRRPQTRWVIATLLVATGLIMGLWLGRRSAPAAAGSIGGIPSHPRPAMQLGRSRSP